MSGLAIDAVPIVLTGYCCFLHDIITEYSAARATELFSMLSDRMTNKMHSRRKVCILLAERANLIQVMNAKYMLKVLLCHCSWRNCRCRSYLKWAVPCLMTSIHSHVTVPHELLFIVSFCHIFLTLIVRTVLVVLTSIFIFWMDDTTYLLSWAKIAHLFPVLSDCGAKKPKEKERCFHHLGIRLKALVLFFENETKNPGFGKAMVVMEKACTITFLRVCFL